MTVLTSTSSGAIAPVSRPNTYLPGVRRGAAAQAAPSYSKYDQASFSAVPKERSAFMDAVSRISQEVRTAHTTGDIQELRRSVAAGEYTPDPMAIAGRMLFLVGD